MILRFFGSLGERIGREIELDAGPQTCTIADLRRELASRFPHSAAQLLSPSVRASIDDAIVEDSAVVTADSRVEFFPPLSGG